MSDYFVGLDFGASSVKAVALNDKNLTPLTLNTNINDGRKELVNYIHYDTTKKSGVQKNVGIRARNLELLAPQNTISWIKRKLLLPNWSKHIESLNRDVTAWEAAKDILDSVKKMIGDYSGGADQIRAAITVPVNFSTLQRRQLKATMEASGLIVERVLTEPFAAIFSLNEIENLGEQLIFVFDFGASTLDLSVIKIDTTDGLSVKELVAAGLNFGGIDIDEAIAEKIIKPKYKAELDEYFNDLAATDSEEVARAKLDSLTINCVRGLKETMFGDDEDEVEGNIDTVDVTLTRDEVIELFEREDYKSRIIETLDNLFFELAEGEDCFDREDVTMVLPFGGTSHIEYFTDILSDYFEDKFDGDDFDFGDIDDLHAGLGDRYMAVAGGAVACMNLMNSGKTVEIENVIPFRLGYEWRNQFISCIGKNAPRGFEAKAMPLEIAEMKARGWKLDIYQSFSLESTAINRLDGNDDGAVFIGTVTLDESAYEPDADILVRFKVLKGDTLRLRFYQLQAIENEQSEVVECEEILFSIGD